MQPINFSSFNGFEGDWKKYGDEILWKDRCWLVRKVLLLFSFEETRLMRLMKLFQAAMEANENQKYTISDSLKIRKKICDIVTERIRQKRLHPLKQLIWTIQFIWSLVDKKVLLLPTHKHLEDAQIAITLNQCSFAYRNADLQKLSRVEAAATPIFQTMQKLALDWKKRSKTYSEEQKKALTERDKDTLLKLCRYEAYTRLLLENPRLLNKVFKNTIEQAFSVSCLVNMPTTFVKLYRCHLSTQLGALHRYCGEGKPRIRRVKLLRDAQGKIEGIGLLSADEKRFLNMNKEDVEPILAEFGAKNIRSGKYTLLYNGITKHDPHEMENIDWTKLDWYYDGHILDKMTFEELQKWFPKKKIEKGDWVWAFATTRTGDGYEITGSHGFIVMFEPVEDGMYRVWSMGKFAKIWPQEYLEFMNIMANTVEATTADPEPNYTYSQRQKALVPVVIKANDKLSQETYRKNLRDWVQNPHKVFQVWGENCTYDPEKLILQKEPQLTRTRIEDLPIPFVLKPIVLPYLLTPQKLKKIVMWISVFLMGGWRTLHGKSVLTGPLLKYGFIYHPASLNQRIKEGIVEGVIWGGHNLDHEPLTKYEV